MAEVEIVSIFKQNVALKLLLLNLPLLVQVYEAEDH